MNVSKKGVGFRVGSKHSGVSFGPSGTRVSASIPGTGISYSSKVGGGKKAKSSSAANSFSSPQTPSAVSNSISKPPFFARTCGLIIGAVLLIGGLGNIGSNIGAAVFGIIAGLIILGGGLYLRHIDPSIANYGKVKKALADPQVRRQIKIFDDSLTLLMETREPKTFFGRYIDAANAVYALEQLTSAPCIHGLTPRQILYSLDADRKDITNAFLMRYAQEIRLKSFQLTRGRKQKLESFKLITAEYENQMPPECIAYRDALYADMLARVDDV